MNHNRIIAVQVFLPPHALKEPLGGDDLAPVLTEHPENVKLNGGEAQLPVVEGTLVGGPVDDQAVEVNDVPAVAGLVSLVVAGVAAQLGFDPGHQLQRVEGLGNVVVRADGEAGDLVHVLRLGGEHEYREVVLLADFPAEGKAADVGEHHVQDGQVQSLVPHHGQRLGAGTALEHGAPLALQIDLYQIGNLRLVVHNQNPRVHGIRPLFQDIIAKAAAASQGRGVIVRKTSELARPGDVPPAGAGSARDAVEFLYVQRSLYAPAGHIAAVGEGKVGGLGGVKREGAGAVGGGAVSGGAEIDAEVNARQAAEGGRDLKIARGLQYG